MSTSTRERIFAVRPDGNSTSATTTSGSRFALGALKKSSQCTSRRLRCAGDHLGVGGCEALSNTRSILSYQQFHLPRSFWFINVCVVILYSR
jgi:hypothetical protein